MPLFRRRPRRAAGAAAVALLSQLSAASSPQPPAVTPQDLARIWDREHVSPPLPPLLDHGELERRLGTIAHADPGRFTVERAGESLEGRSINLVTAGSGPFRVLLWSQMHGDEPTATAALLDIFDYLARHAADPPVQQMLSALTLSFIPMLNPDGAERFQRRNAQGIDINRDALRLQTPEGRLLKSIRDRLNPRVGFNLHNENWRTSVGDPPRPASVSLLSVAYDPARSENSGRRLTKKLCAVVRDALEPFASGQIGRYDEDFETRAFGDNLTLWGTPVILIETGAYPSAEPDPALVRLNFIGILSALQALATGSVEKADPGRYESLPSNEMKEMFVIVRNATVNPGTGVAPFLADVGITATRIVKTVEGRRTAALQARIDDLGDLRTYGALRTIDGSGLVVAPLYDESIREGQEIALPDWSRQPSPRTIAAGQAAEIMLLRPGAVGRFLVDTILRF